MMEPAARLGMVDFTAQWADVGSDVLAAVERVGRSGRLVLGEEVVACEAAVAQAFGRRHAVGCASGLDAIELSLRVAGVRPGGRVVTTPLTAFATTLAIVRAGAVPVFVDTDDTGQMCPVEAARAVAAGPVDAVLPVHLYGHACDVAALAALAHDAQVPLIEDCAQAILNPAAGRAGVAAAVSFYPTKNLGAYGDGGALVTDDDDRSEQARRLRNYGQSGRYEHPLLGLNSRLDELQAAVLSTAMLPRVAAATRRRARIAAAVAEGIRHPALRVVGPAEGRPSVWHLLPVSVTGSRDAFRRHLDTCGIDSNVHYPVLCPDQGALAGTAFAVVGDLARARRLAAAEVSLPLHPYLDDTDVDRIIAACNTWSTS